MSTIPNPPVDYTSKDYASFRQDMIDAIDTRMPEWTSRSPNDFGIILIELFAYMGDMLSFYGDRIANEAFLDTAVLRSSVLNIATMLDYRPTQNVAAQVTLQFTTRAGGGNVFIPAGTQVSTVPVTGQDPTVFETTTGFTITDTPPNQGSITALQGKTISAEAMGTSDGTVNQSFSLFNTPVIQDSQIIFVDEGIGLGPVSWSFIPNLIDAGAADNAYTTYTDENDVLNVQFGDNVNGRIPPAGSLISATYRIGGGVSGDVGANTLTVMVASIANVLNVTNPSAADGGADAETLDDIRVNAPLSLTTMDRAVTVNDYSNLALKVSGVAKAHALAVIYSSVYLYIAPFNGSPTNMASSALKSQVLAYINARKTINTTVSLLDPTYVPVNVTAAVNVLSQFKQVTVQQDVLKAVNSVLSFDNVGFAYRVTISQIYKAIMAVAGVDYVVVSVLSRTGSGLADVQMADAEIPSIGTVTITATGGIV